MNVLSLPDEMLANVLKFSKFEAIVRLRKINTRIDKVTTSYGVNRPKIWRIIVTADQLILFVSPLNIEEHQPTTSIRITSYSIRIPCTDPLLGLENQLNKVRNIEILCIGKMDLEVALLEGLARVKLRHRMIVQLISCNIKVPSVDMKRVLSEYRSVEIHNANRNTLMYNEGSVASDKVNDHLAKYSVEIKLQQ